MKRFTTKNAKFGEGIKTRIKEKLLTEVATARDALRDELAKALESVK